jgi:hypothetical protein
MCDCDFAKDCLNAAVWLGGKPTAFYGVQSRYRYAQVILLSCAVHGIRNYLVRHGCMSRSSRAAQLLSRVFELIPSPPPEFSYPPDVSDVSIGSPMPRALAAAASAFSTNSSAAHTGDLTLQAAAAVVRAFLSLSAAERSVDSPIHLLQMLPHMQSNGIARFSSIHIFCKTLHSLCSSLETHNMHALACVAYILLLSLPFLRHRRAHWWTRLCINIENVRFPLAKPQDSPCTAEPILCAHSELLVIQEQLSSPLTLADSVLLSALGDDMVPKEYLHCLVHRAQRSIDGRSASESSKRLISDAISGLHLAVLSCPPEIVIEGRPSNRTAGQKSHFIGFDDSVGVSVEALALQWCVCGLSHVLSLKQHFLSHSFHFRYAMEENGGWQGVHCEGAMMFSIFALLMFDIIWSSTVSQWTFSSTYSDAPLDFG